MLPTEAALLGMAIEAMEKPAAEICGTVTAATWRRVCRARVIPEDAVAARRTPGAIGIVFHVGESEYRRWAWVGAVEEPVSAQGQEHREAESDQRPIGTVPLSLIHASSRSVSVGSDPGGSSETAIW